MQRSFRSTATGLAAGIVLLGGAAAQQTPAKPAQSTTTTTHRRPTTTAAAKPKPLPLTTEKDKQSYAIGLNVGKSLHRDDIEIEPKFVLQGLQDAMGGGPVLLTDDQIKTVMTDLEKNFLA